MRIHGSDKQNFGLTKPKSSKHGFTAMGMYLMILAMMMAFGQDMELKLEDLKWKNRVVLFFPVEGEQDLEMTDRVLLELEERKLALYIFGDSLVSNHDKTFSPTEINQLQKRYQMGSNKSCWVLIGLDGGVKLRKEGDLDMDLILKTIDSMPMRMSEKKGN